jgi:hypothetical protein
MASMGFHTLSLMTSFGLEVFCSEFHEQCFASYPELSAEKAKLQRSSPFYCQFLESPHIRSLLTPPCPEAGTNGRLPSRLLQKNKPTKYKVGKPGLPAARPPYHRELCVNLK